MARHTQPLAYDRRGRLVRRLVVWDGRCWVEMLTRRGWEQDFGDQDTIEGFQPVVLGPDGRTLMYPQESARDNLPRHEAQWRAEVRSMLAQAPDSRRHFPLKRAVSPTEVIACPRCGRRLIASRDHHALT